MKDSTVDNNFSLKRHILRGLSRQFEFGYRWRGWIGYQFIFEKNHCVLGGKYTENAEMYAKYRLVFR
jgi:hypothetical protein